MGADAIGEILVGNVRCSDDAVEALQDGRVIDQVKLGEIRAVSLRFGRTAKHPWIQFVAGLVLVALGTLPAIHMVMWLTHGGVFVAWEVFIVLFGALGIFVTWESVQMGHYLEVATAKGNKRLAFAHGTRGEEIRLWMEALERRLAAQDAGRE